MEADMMDEQEMEDDADMNEPQTQMNDVEENPHGLLAAAGLEDSDAEDEPVIYFLMGIMTFKTCYLHTILWLEYYFAIWWWANWLNICIYNLVCVVSVNCIINWVGS